MIRPACSCTSRRVPAGQPSVRIALRSPIRPLLSIALTAYMASIGSLEGSGSRGRGNDRRTLLTRPLVAPPAEGAAELELLAQRARLDLAGPRPLESPDPYDGLGFSPREREVLGLLAYGYTNRQIATHLTISVKTASVHVSHILGKLGVAQRIEAAAIAQKLNPPATTANLTSASSVPDRLKALLTNRFHAVRRTFGVTELAGFGRWQIRGFPDGWAVTQLNEAARGCGRPAAFALFAEAI